MMYANAFKEKFKLVDGLVPEELGEAFGESGSVERVDLPDEIAERKNGVSGNVVGEGERQGPGGVKVFGQGLLTFLDDSRLVLGMDIGKVWEF